MDDWVTSKIANLSPVRPEGVTTGANLGDPATSSMGTGVQVMQAHPKNFDLSKICAKFQKM